MSLLESAGGEGLVPNSAAAIDAAVAPVNWAPRKKFVAAMTIAAPPSAKSPACKVRKAIICADLS